MYSKESGDTCVVLGALHANDHCVKERKSESAILNRGLHATYAIGRHFWNEEHWELSFFVAFHEFSFVSDQEGSHITSDLISFSRHSLDDTQVS